MPRHSKDSPAGRTRRLPPKKTKSDLGILFFAIVFGLLICMEPVYKVVEVAGPVALDAFVAGVILWFLLGRRRDWRTRSPASARVGLVLAGVVNLSLFSWAMAKQGISVGGISAIVLALEFMALGWVLIA